MQGFLAQRGLYTMGHQCILSRQHLSLTKLKSCGRLIHTGIQHNDMDLWNLSFQYNSSCRPNLSGSVGLEFEQGDGDAHAREWIVGAKLEFWAKLKCESGWTAQDSS